MVGDQVGVPFTLALLVLLRGSSGQLAEYRDIKKLITVTGMAAEPRTNLISHLASRSTSSAEHDKAVKTTFASKWGSCGDFVSLQVYLDCIDREGKRSRILAPVRREVSFRSLGRFRCS